MSGKIPNSHPSEIIAALNSFKDDQFYHWLYRLLFNRDNREAPHIAIGRDETLDSVLLDIYGALSPGAQRHFAYAVEKCLDALPRDSSTAPILQTLTQLVQFTVPPKARERLDEFLHSEYLCKLSAAGHSLRYWILAARCLYSIDDDIAAYMLRTAALENDSAYTNRCLAVLIRNPSKLATALELLPQVFTDLTANPAHANQALYHTRTFIDNYGPAKLTEWLSKRTDDMFALPTVSPGFQLWRTKLWEFVTAQVTASNSATHSEWLALIRAILSRQERNSTSTMEEMRDFITNTIDLKRHVGYGQEFIYKAADEFKSKFADVNIAGELDAASIWKSEEFPVSIRTVQQLYIVGCCPATYTGSVLQWDKGGSFARASLPCQGAAT